MMSSEISVLLSVAYSLPGVLIVADAAGSSTELLIGDYENIQMQLWKRSFMHNNY